MQFMTGTVVEGKVVLDGELPEGTVVKVLADDEPGVVLPPHLQAELEEAILEADREEGISLEQLMHRLDRLPGS